MSAVDFRPKTRYGRASGRGTQVVRERSAKPLCVGSIPTRASRISQEHSRFQLHTSLGRIGLNWAKSVENPTYWGGGRTRILRGEEEEKRLRPDASLGSEAGVPHHRGSCSSPPS